MSHNSSSIFLSHWISAKKEIIRYKGEMSFSQFVPCGFILFKHGLYHVSDSSWLLVYVFWAQTLLSLHMILCILGFYFLKILQMLSALYIFIFCSYFSDCKICVHIEEFLPSRHSLWRWICGTLNGNTWEFF